MMLRLAGGRSLLVFLSCLLAACSSSSRGSAPTSDAGADAPVSTSDAGGDAAPPADAAADAPPSASDSGDAAPGDAGGDAAPKGDAALYPAFAPDMPVIVNEGGAILSKPEIVTVTWNSDPNAAKYEAFDDAIGGSSYWKSSLAPYGVGAATGGAARHVRITTAPPASMKATQLDTLIADNVAAAPGNGWPARTNQTEYVVYTPAGMTLTDGGPDACNLEAGYHDETSSGSLQHIVYAVVIQSCHDQQNVVEYSTEVASHEIAEAATDPHAESDLAWAYFDSNHLAWDLWQGDQDEIADACEYLDDAFYQEPALNAWVQRLWSNTSWKAGHNPCVPLPSAPYYNVTPLNLQTVTVTTAGSATPVTSKGFRIPVGQQKTLGFGLYSDAPMAPWTVDAVEGDGFTPPSPARLSISLGSTSGANGDIVHVTVGVNSGGKASGILMTVMSTSGGLTHYMPVLIGAY